MSKSLLVFCMLICIVCLTNFNKSCVRSMSVNEITSGGLLADMRDEKPPHHLRHNKQQQQQQQQQEHHHHNHHLQHHHNHHQHNINKTSESLPSVLAANARHSPDMWTILGQTVKSHDGSNEQNDYENDAKYYKEFEQQQLQEKFMREHGAHDDADQSVEHPKKSLSCPKCQSRPELRMTEEELTNLRIEYVKNQILQKLRLTERPQVSASNIPKPVAEGATIHQENAQEQIKRAPDEFYGKTTQKIVFPKLDNEHCRGMENVGSFMCFTLQIPADIEYEDVESAELWVYKQPHILNTGKHSFLVSEIENWDTKSIMKPFAIQDTNDTEEWVKIDIAWSIQNWIKYNHLNHIIDISCNTCEKHPSLDLFSLDHDYRPFIVINTHTNRPMKRQRRSINCSAGVSECCREKLYISFAEIGWDDWILHPPGYDAYFCRGSCASAATITLSGSHYNTVVRKVMYHRNSSSNRNSNTKSLEMVPCCTATQFSSLQLFYMDSNNTATQKTLPNMVVEACGCM